jgi:predicted amidohydrolase YtcJ
VHAHLDGIGERELTFNLKGTASPDELKNKLHERAAQGKPGDWLPGRGWIESRWTPPAFPTRKDLDAAAPDRPVVLGRADGHASLANSLALKRAGIDRNTADAAGGSILKDAAMLDLYERAFAAVPVPQRAVADPRWRATGNPNLQR